LKNKEKTLDYIGRKNKEKKKKRKKKKPASSMAAV